MSQNDKLQVIAKKLEKQIIKTHEPESTKWKRNHTEVAEWYLIWSESKFLK